MFKKTLCTLLAILTLAFTFTACGNEEEGGAPSAPKFTLAKFTEEMKIADSDLALSKNDGVYSFDNDYVSYSVTTDANDIVTQFIITSKSLPASQTDSVNKFTSALNKTEGKMSYYDLLRVICLGRAMCALNFITEKNSYTYESAASTVAQMIVANETFGENGWTVVFSKSDDCVIITATKN